MSNDISPNTLPIVNLNITVYMVDEPVVTPVEGGA